VLPWATGSVNSTHEATASHRSRERYRRAGFGYAATISARAVSFVVGIVTIPLTLPYLGPERFGMWMTMNSLVTLFGFANLGIGLSLMNRVAEQEGLGEEAAQRGAFSSALAVSVGVAGGLSVLAVLVGPLVPWWRVFNVSSPLAIAEAGPSMAVMTGSFLLAMPMGLSSNVWAGLQRTYVPPLLIGLGAFLGIAGIAACVLTGQGVPSLVAAGSGGPVLALAIGTAVLVIKRPDLRPSAQFVTRNSVRQLLRVGLGFFLLQIAIAVATTADSLVLAQVVGPSSVAEYATVWRLFNVPLVLATSVGSVLWPGLSEARSRGDLEWVRATHRRVLLAASAITLPLVVALGIAGPAVSDLVGAGRVSPGQGRGGNYCRSPHEYGVSVSIQCGRGMAPCALLGDHGRMQHCFGGVVVRPSRNVGCGLVDGDHRGFDAHPTGVARAATETIGRSFPVRRSRRIRGCRAGK
jgi:O-antigen/teichoic acid export membrane protein